MGDRIMIERNKIKEALNNGMMVHTKGYVYIGYYGNCRKYGCIKCGSTGNIKLRLKQLFGLKPIAIAEFDYISQPDLLKIESDIRVELSQDFVHFGNDHFAYLINGNYNTPNNVWMIQTLVEDWIEDSVKHLETKSPNTYYNYTIHYGK